jgi:adenosylcobinamide kinase/adenosylcobinamide-phosphate guanylyltransferase
LADKGLFMNTIVMISGGARSGKSLFGESLAIACNNTFSDKRKIAYLATGEPLDEEFKLRIKKHKEKRPPVFKVYEESLTIYKVCKEQYARHNVFLVECLTTWLGNIFHKIKEDKIEDFLAKGLKSLIKPFKSKVWEASKKNTCSGYLLDNKITAGVRSFKEILEAREADDKVLITVANEVGLGIVPVQAVARQYRDMHGWMNQKMAEAADCLFFMAAGIPLRIK